MIGASIRIMLLALVAVGFTLVLSVMYVADLRSTSGMRSQRNVVRGNLRRPQRSVRRHTLQLSSY